MLFAQYFVEVTLSFSNLLYEVKEDGGFIQPVLTLNNKIDCCSTVSVWINIMESTAKSKITLYYLHLCTYKFLVNSA